MVRLLAIKPHKVPPLPEGLTEEQKVAYRKRAPWREKDYQARVVTMGNLRTNVRVFYDEDKPVSIPESIPTPPVPAARLQVSADEVIRPEKTLQGKYARAVYSRQEFDLWCHTWVEFLTAHPEWNNPVDLLDLATICNETAIQHRILQQQFLNPKIDITGPFNASSKRLQKARENLTARRVDKTGTKANNSNTTVNVAVLAGEIPPEVAAMRRQKYLEDRRGEDDFLEGTVVQRHMTIDTPEDE